MITMDKFKSFEVGDLCLLDKKIKVVISGINCYHLKNTQYEWHVLEILLLETFHLGSVTLFYTGDLQLKIFNSLITTSVTDISSIEPILKFEETI